MFISYTRYIYKPLVHHIHLPDEWKHANITAIDKKENKNIPGNYRPISLTSIICKLLEKPVRNSIVNYTKTNNWFTRQQLGFIGGRSTVLQLIQWKKWTNILDMGGCIEEICDCDFMKAFDKVPHRRLLDKLRYYGIEGQIHKWIASFLTNRKQRVVVNSAYSEWQDVLR